MFYLTACLLVILSSCSGVNKSLKKSGPDTRTRETESVNTPEIPITEKEEKLVPVDNQLPDPGKYFVVIGSFRNPDNARKFQQHISRDGFGSELLRNDLGLYRVCTMTSDDSETARTEIRRIRRLYPDYSDVWLLIQKK